MVNPKRFTGGVLKSFQLVPSSKDHRNWSKIVLGMVIVFLSPVFIFAEDQLTEVEKANRERVEQIQIVADKLISNNVEKYAEFVGDVKTTYADLVIDSQSLKIYYKDDLPGPKNAQGDQENIQRLVASGNVSIASDKYTAETQSAEYDMDTMILVLFGENSRIQSGKNVLTGSKITIDRKDGRIKVDGSPQKRVKAVFYSNKIPEEKQKW
jgi:lipopolysaccharide export system protein LptA